MLPPIATLAPLTPSPDFGYASYGGSENSNSAESSYGAGISYGENLHYGGENSHYGGQNSHYGDDNSHYGGQNSHYGAEASYDFEQSNYGVDPITEPTNGYADYRQQNAPKAASPVAHLHHSKRSLAVAAKSSP